MAADCSNDTCSLVQNLSKCLLTLSRLLVLTGQSGVCFYIPTATVSLQELVCDDGLIWFCWDSGFSDTHGLKWTNTGKEFAQKSHVQVEQRRRNQDLWKRPENEVFSTSTLRKLCRASRLTTLIEAAAVKPPDTTSWLRIVLHRLYLHLHSAPFHSDTAVRKRSSSLCGAALIKKNINSYSSAHKHTADWT